MSDISNKFSYPLLGIDLIDRQHATFFNMLDSIAQNGSKENDTIKKLEDYLIFHFRIEEDLFKNTDYPDVDVHISQHLYFTQQVEKFRIESNFNGKFLDEKVLEFMKKWFLNHILHTDMQYKDYVDTSMKDKQAISN